MRSINRDVVKFQGIIKDLPPGELIFDNVWTSGENVHFDDRGTHRCSGYNAFADSLPADTRPIFVHPVLTPETAYWIWVHRSTDGLTHTVYVTDGTNHFDITPSGGIVGAEAGHWQGTTLNNLPVINNGFDAPMWWDGQTSNPMEYLPDWPADTTCKSIRAFKYHLIAMNITESSVQQVERVLWSSAADAGAVPASWTPEPGNDAGDTILADNTGPIIDGGPLRDFFVIYKQHSTYLCQYIAGNYVFSFRNLFVTSGIQALNCWVEIRGRHVVMTDDDVIQHDGQKFESIIDEKLRNYGLYGINPTNQAMCQVVARNDTDEVWVVLPTVDNTWQDIALVYAFTEGVWGARRLPGTAFVANGIVPYEQPDPTWDGAATTWATDPRWWNQANFSISNDSLLMADPGPSPGHLFLVDGQQDNNGEPLQAFIERSQYAVGGEEQLWVNKLIHRVVFHFEGNPGDELQVRIGTQQGSSQSVSWGPEQTITIAQSGAGGFVDVLQHGRFISIRIGSNGGSDWKLHQMGIEWVPLARY